MQPPSTPPDSYPGGKPDAGVSQWVTNLRPPHAVYIKPFLGHGAVFRHKRPAQCNTVSTVTLAPYTMCGPGSTSTQGMPTALPAVPDALAFLRAYPLRGDELVYGDPPDVRRTRRTRTRLSPHAMDDAQHAALLTILRRLPCAVLVSGSRSALYDELLRDWCRSPARR